MKNKLPPNPEDKVFAHAASAISKAVLYICMVIIFCFGMSTCQLNSQAIESCEESCQSIGSEMKSITSFKCICATKDTRFNLMEPPTMVIPSK